MNDRQNDSETIPSDADAESSAPQAMPDGLDEQLDEIYALRGVAPIPDPRAPSDPVFTEMIRLSTQPERIRDEVLEPYMMAWLERREEPLAIARYLAAAGLLREEGEKLEHAVRQRWVGSLRLDALGGIFGGLALMGAGCWVLIDRVFPFWGILGLVLTASGLVSIVRGGGLLRRIVPMRDRQF